MPFVFVSVFYFVVRHFYAWGEAFRLPPPALCFAAAARLSFDAVRVMRELANYFSLLISRRFVADDAMPCHFRHAGKMPFSRRQAEDARGGDDAAAATRWHEDEQAEIADIWEKRAAQERYRGAATLSSARKQRQPLYFHPRDLKMRHRHVCATP
jgi:hypothetical protein